jgi:hypothetical protein
MDCYVVLVVVQNTILRRKHTRVLTMAFDLPSSKSVRTRIVILFLFTKKAQMRENAGQRYVDLIHKHIYMANYAYRAVCIRAKPCGPAYLEYEGGGPRVRRLLEPRGGTAGDG